MKLALVAVVVALAIFVIGALIGYRLADRPDAVTNDRVDSKIDILLNIATNGAARDFRH